MRKPRLLILNGSISEIPLIEQGKKLGYEVITTGNDSRLIGHPFADKYIPADYSDYNAILSLVNEYEIDRIVACANDFGVITASYVAEKKHWPGHDTYENACILHQKDRCKDLIQKLGIRTPISHAFDNREMAAQYVRSAEYPLIVKATDLTGGKGIMRADNLEEALIAIDNAFSCSRKKSIVIEPFIVGTQQSIDTFVIDGKVCASVSNDVFCPINPYLIQSEILPAAGIEAIQDELHRYIELICYTLGLVDGMFTLQYIVRDGKPYIIELMRRCLGNQFLTVAHAVSGFPFEEALVRAETGLDLSCLKWEKPIAPVAGHHGIMAPKNGVVKGYTIDPILEPFIFKRVNLLLQYDGIDNYMNQRIGYLYLKFPDHDVAIDIAKRLNDLIYVYFNE